MAAFLPSPEEGVRRGPTSSVTTGTWSPTQLTEKQEQLVGERTSPGFPGWITRQDGGTFIPHWASSSHPSIAAPTPTPPKASSSVQPGGAPAEGQKEGAKGRGLDPRPCLRAASG